MEKMTGICLHAIWHLVESDVDLGSMEKGSTVEVFARMTTPLEITVTEGIPGFQGLASGDLVEFALERGYVRVTACEEKRADGIL